MEMNAKMVSMKKENEGISGAKNGGGEVAEMEQPQYPWGLRLNLDNETWSKIADNSEIPNVGDKMHYMINVEVVGVKSEINQGEGKEVYVDLQITDIGKCEEKKENASHAMKLYGKKEG